MVELDCPCFFIFDKKMRFEARNSSHQELYPENHFLSTASSSAQNTITSGKINSLDRAYVLKLDTCNYYWIKFRERLCFEKLSWRKTGHIILYFLFELQPEIGKRWDVHSLSAILAAVTQNYSPSSTVPHCPSIRGCGKNPEIWSRTLIYMDLLFAV